MDHHDKQPNTLTPPPSTLPPPPTNSDTPRVDDDAAFKTPRSINDSAFKTPLSCASRKPRFDTSPSSKEVSFCAESPRVTGWSRDTESIRRREKTPYSPRKCRSAMRDEDD